MKLLFHFCPNLKFFLCSPELVSAVEGFPNRFRKNLVQEMLPNKNYLKVMSVIISKLDTQQSSTFKFPNRRKSRGLRWVVECS